MTDSEERRRAEALDHVHVPAVPPRIGPRRARPPADLLAALRGVPAAEVSDVVGRLYTMHPRIRPLYEPVRRAVGVALTVKAYPGDNLAVHGGLSLVRPDDVLVVSWSGYADGCGSGAESLQVPISNGLQAVVIDGAWRDLEDLQRQDFPVFGRGSAAFSPTKREPGELNVPVECGDVVVEEGDVVVADGEAVVIVPRWCLDRVVGALAAKPRVAGQRSAADLVEGTAARTRLFAEAYRERGGQGRFAP